MRWPTNNRPFRVRCHRFQMYASFELPDVLFRNRRTSFGFRSLSVFLILLPVSPNRVKRLAYNVKIQQYIAISLEFSAAWIFVIESSSFRYCYQFIHIFIPFLIFIRIYRITPHMPIHFKANSQIHVVQHLKRLLNLRAQ